MTPEPKVIEGESGPTSAGWHSIEAAFRCLKEFQLQHIRGISTPQVQTPDHFAIGSLFHAGRARWFARQFGTDTTTWESVKDAIKEEAQKARLPVSLDAERRCLEILEQYIPHWAARPRPTPIATEYKLGPAPVSPGDPFQLWRTARLDDLSRYPEAGGALCIGEGKTTSADLSTCVNEYTLHGQILLQAALYHLAPEGEKRWGPIAGIMLDVVKKPYGRDKAKFLREFIPVNPHVLTWFVRELRGMMRLTAQIDWDAEVSRNISACTRAVGKGRVTCNYRDLCMQGRSAGNRFVTRDGQLLTQHQPVDGARKMPWE